ncbi:MAG TPA: hypothetical protein VNV15_02905 [Opitutaceae bacterium]|jgi:hypothetical protein|nr:hypothetical protein [Opitutaceae bacterium]
MPLSGAKPRELVVTTFFTEQHLASRDIEEQTKVEHRQNRVFLWVAIKSVLEDCFSAWAQISVTQADVFIQQAGEARSCAMSELNRLVLAAYANPLGLKAVARVTQLGINARRTLDIGLEALLDYPTQKSAGGKMGRPALRIDWALGGLAEWPQAYPFVFEESMATGLAKNRAFYSTEKNVRKDITAKQIANIFWTTSEVIDSLEAKALGMIRKSFKHSEALDEYSQDFLASH